MVSGNCDFAGSSRRDAQPTSGGDVQFIQIYRQNYQAEIQPNHRKSLLRPGLVRRRIRLDLFTIQFMPPTINEFAQRGPYHVNDLFLNDTEEVEVLKMRLKERHIKPSRILSQLQSEYSLYQLLRCRCACYWRNLRALQPCFRITPTDQKTVGHTVEHRMAKSRLIRSSTQMAPYDTSWHQMAHLTNIYRSSLAVSPA